VINTAIVLAGGLGTRLRSLVSDVPKPMAPVLGRPFLTYLLDYWIGQGIKQIILSVSYRHDIISDYFGSSYRGAQIHYSVEEIPLGTGGGFILAYKKYQINEPFLLLNGDTYFPVELSALNLFSMQRDADWCFSMFHTKESNRYLKILASPEKNYLIEFQLEHSDVEWANAGVYWVNPRGLVNFDQFENKPLNLEKDIVMSCYKAGQSIYGFQVEAPFLDIGLPQDYLKAETIIIQK